MAERYVPNPAFKTQLRSTPRFKKGMIVVTGGVAMNIKEAALPFRDSGQFIKQVKVRFTQITLEPRFAHIMEFGSVNNVPQHNVRRGVREAGLRFVDSGPNVVEKLPSASTRARDFGGYA